MVTFQLTETERTERWTVTGVPTSVNHRGVEFVPGSVTLTFRNGEPWLVTIHGTTRNSRPTSTNHSIEDGHIQPDTRLGAAPDWLTELLDVSYETPLTTNTTAPITPTTTARASTTATLEVPR